MANHMITSTPYGTMHVDVVVPAAELKSARRALGALSRRNGWGERLSVREHTFGRYARLGAIYRSHKGA